MPRPLLTSWMTFPTLLAGVALPVYAAVNVPPEVAQQSAEKRLEYIRLQSEFSLQDKLKMGARRYEERQLARANLAEQLRFEASRREDEATGRTSAIAANEEQARAAETDYTDYLWLGALVLAGFHVFRLHRQGEFNSMFEAPLQMKPAEPPSAAETAPVAPIDPVRNCRELVRSMDIPVNLVEDTVPTAPAPEPAASDAPAKPALSRRQQLRELQSVRLILDISEAAKPLLDESSIQEQLQTRLRKFGLSLDDNAPIWIGVFLHGRWDDKHIAFTHKQKLAVLAADALAVAADSPEMGRAVLWGTGYTGFAEEGDVQSDVLDAASVLLELFTMEVRQAEPMGATATAPAALVAETNETAAN